ncbi:MAG: hypothetical protein IJU08_05380 [Bacteroidales bacterium]|nr:hypothetical protein [Bacteroidales bacterium]
MHLVSRRPINNCVAYYIRDYRVRNSTCQKLFLEMYLTQ